MSSSSISLVIVSPPRDPADLPLAGAREVIAVVSPDMPPLAGEGDGKSAVRRIESEAPAGQRANIGISLASGDWVVVLGGSERLSPDWLRKVAHAVTKGAPCVHRFMPREGGPPILAVWRPAFSYGSLHGQIDDAGEAMAHWLAEIFPRHRHRVLVREGYEDHEASWLRSDAPAGAGQNMPSHAPAAPGREYAPQQFWESGGTGWVKWEAYQPDEPEIRAMVDPLSPECVLELGCGAGRNARYFSGAGRYVGLDISQPLLARAGERQSANGTGLVCGDAVRLPFAASAFDLVFSDSTLQHVFPRDIAACIGDIARVSRRHIVVIEFTDELDGRDSWFQQTHMFRHDYAALFAPHAELVHRVPTSQQIQPAIKEAFVFEKRGR